MDNVIDRDHADKPAGYIDNRCRNQRVFLETERNLLLVHIDLDQGLLALHHVRHADIARRSEYPAQLCRADRLVLRIDNEDFPEIGRQVLIVAEIIDHLPDRHMFGHGNQVALHQAARGLLRVGQRLFDRCAIVGRKLAQDGALVFLLHVLDDRDSVVGLEFAGNVRHFARIERVDQFFADMIVQFRDHVSVKQVGKRLGEIRTQVGRRLFEQVGDVGRMERRNQLADALVFSGFDRVEDLSHECRFQLVVLVEMGIGNQVFRADRISFAHLSLRPGSPFD